jgi:hypothetical protein
VCFSQADLTSNRSGPTKNSREAVRFLGELIPAQAPRIGSQRLCGRSGQVRSASTFAIALGP